MFHHTAEVKMALRTLRKTNNNLKFQNLHLGHIILFKYAVKIKLSPTVGQQESNRSPFRRPLMIRIHILLTLYIQDIYAILQMQEQTYFISRTISRTFPEQRNANYLFQCEFFLTHAPCHDQPNLPPLAQEAHLVINPSASDSWTIHSDAQLLAPKQGTDRKTS